MFHHFAKIIKISFQKHFFFKLYDNYNFIVFVNEKNFI